LNPDTFVKTMITFEQYIYAQCDFDFLEVEEEHVMVRGRIAAPRVAVYERTTKETILGYSEYEYLGER
jgi:hypothetical protein